VSDTSLLQEFLLLYTMPVADAVFLTPRAAIKVNRADLMGLLSDDPISAAR